MLRTTPHEWVVMMAAGLFNLVAFLALVKALQLIALSTSTP